MPKGPFRFVKYAGAAAAAGAPGVPLEHHAINKLNMATG